MVRRRVAVALVLLGFAVLMAGLVAGGILLALRFLRTDVRATMTPAPALPVATCAARLEHHGEPFAAIADARCRGAQGLPWYLVRVTNAGERAVYVSCSAKGFDAAGGTLAETAIPLPVAFGAADAYLRAGESRTGRWYLARAPAAPIARYAASCAGQLIAGS